MTITEPEGGNEYGMRAIAAWLDDDDFPLTAGDLRDRFADRELMLAHDLTVSFGDVLEEVEDDEYASLTEMWAGLGEGFRAVDPRAHRYLD